MNHKKNQTIKDLLRAAATPAEWKDEWKDEWEGALRPPGLRPTSLMSELIKRRTALLQELSEVQKLINLTEKK